MTYVGRLAPSPTGALHLGNVRTFMVAWLRARSQGGKVVFRMEDLDHPRDKPDAAAAAVEDLRWLGFDWDEEFVQSGRRDVYRDALAFLRGRGLAYPAFRRTALLSRHLPRALCVVERRPVAAFAPTRSVLAVQGSGRFRRRLRRCVRRALRAGRLGGPRRLPAGARRGRGGLHPRLRGRRPSHGHNGGCARRRPAARDAGPGSCRPRSRALAGAEGNAGHAADLLPCSPRRRP